jgi:site-specific recombinase XerD
MGFAQSTIKTYSSIVGQYLDFISLDVKNINQTTIIDFSIKYQSSRSREQIKGALNHFIKGVLKQSVKHNYLPKIKQADYKPNILTVDEIIKLINSTKNKKHKAIIALIYYGGLRVSEAINLQVKNINKDGFVKIENSKGAKDRYVPVTDICLNILRQYYKIYKPRNYLFQGQSSDRYTASSIRKILNQNLKRLGVVRNIRVHDLRHSRATHLLENGVDIKVIKEFLGHSKIATTERYLHLQQNTLANKINKAQLKMTA